MKRIVKIIVITFILTGLVVPLFSCRSASQGATASGNQVATVQRGNLAIDITAAGNLALSHKEDLAIQVSGTQQEPVTVREVLVAAGDSVKAEQELVRLDTTTLEKKVTSQERAVKTAEQAVSTAETSLNKTIQDGQIQINTAEIDLETATINFNKLNYPFNYSTFVFDVPAALADITAALHQVEEARAALEAGPGAETYGDALGKVRQAQNNLNTAQERLLKGQAINVYDSQSVSKAVGDYLAARSAKIAMDKAQYSLDQTKSNVQINIDKAKLALENAKDDLNDAQETLNEYKDDLNKTVITAPFDGFVTTVNVKGGDEVKKGTIAAQVADPTKFEANIMVSEMDITRVKLDGSASVKASAISGLTLPAKVTYISPTATIQSGVVNYQVTVELESLQSAALESQLATGNSSSDNVTPGTPSGRFGQAFGGGNLTQEQIDQIRQQGQQTQGGQQAQVPTVTPNNIQLKEGLTVTVSIVLQQKSNVLLVPNGAITSQRGQSYVQVISATGTVEQRAIKTGISNWQYTEVTDGLSEGEKVVVPQGTTTTTTSQQVPRGGMPGIGGILR